MWILPGNQVKIKKNQVFGRKITCSWSEKEAILLSQSGASPRNTRKHIAFKIEAAITIALRQPPI